MKEDDATRQAAADWWQTDIVDMQPDEIRFHGYPIQDLIGQVSFTGMIWLMLKGDVPTAGQEHLFNAALMAGVDHGPQAPSIAIARMAITCGVGINNAMASAANVLGDVHGGAGEQCLMLLQTIRASLVDHESVPAAVRAGLQAFFASGQKFIPGYGHRFHRTDPRAKPLLDLLAQAEKNGDVASGYAELAQTVESELSELKNRRITINIDGATAAIYGALGFEAPLCRGLFVLSRSVGILAHAREQKSREERNKGPIPKGWLWTYGGIPQRPFKGTSEQG